VPKRFLDQALTMPYALSILIPARNEEFLGITIEDVLKNTSDKTEVIAVLDGYTTDVPQIPDDPRVTIIHNATSVGQRAATNQAARLSQSKYVMKLDAHCSFDKDLDTKMLEAIKGHDSWTMAPLMRNLHAFDWVCNNGHRRYQGPSGPCLECGEETKKDIIWIGKKSPQSTSFCFDQEPHFQYFNEFKKRPEGQGDITETMSLQGSCFMLTRDKYFELNICDESLGSWGNQGIEVACKTWLTGGSVMVNQKTWFAHMFRTQGGDFGFPYDNPGKRVQECKKKIRDTILDNKIPNQTRPLSWLIERFWPVPGWSEEMRQKIKNWPILSIPQPSVSLVIPASSEAPSHPTDAKESLKVGCLYYTDNELPDPLATTVRNQILKVIGDKPLVSVSLKPLDFGKNIALPLERGKLTMHKQILRGLYELRDMGIDVVYFLEHDILYGGGYTDFVPPDPNIFYYNSNLWRVRQSDGFSVKYDHKSLSQLCAYIKKLIPEYENRVKVMEDENDGRHFTRGYEPGTRSLRRGGFSDEKSLIWEAEIPNIDVRHETNLSRSKWHPSEFRSHRSCRNWQESDVESILGWENLRALIK